MCFYLIYRMHQREDQDEIAAVLKHKIKNQEVCA